MTTNEIAITRLYNGALQLSAIVNGYRICRTYYGYTKREAVRLFKQAVKQ